MKTLFLALPDESLCSALAKNMGKDYDLTVCHDGEKTLKALQAQKPDILILDLMLPMLDGLQILRELGDQRPELILAVFAPCSNRMLQMAKDLGVDVFLSKPCRPQAVMMATTHLLQLQALPESTLDPQEQTARHLRKLVMPEHRDGFQQLRVGIPLYLADPRQSLSKELYPAIAELCGNGNGNQVERSIRELIHESWGKRNVAVWKQYFPDMNKPPSNKVFLSNLARVLQEEDDF